MQSFGFTTVLNSTDTIEIIDDRAYLTAVPPALLLFLCYAFLSRSQNTWPATCLAATAVVASCANLDPLSVCDYGTSACVMYLLWIGSGALAITVSIAGLARQKDYRHIVRECLASHAVAWCLFWMPARSGGYSLASTPRDAAALDLGPIEGVTNDYSDQDPTYVASARGVTLMIQGLSAMLCINTIAVSRETRFYPWLSFGTLCILLAYLSMIPGEDPSMRTAFNHNSTYSCSLRAAPICEHGVLGSPCTIDMMRVVPLAVYVPLVALAPRVREYANKSSRVHLAPAVLYGAALVLSAFAFLVVSIESERSMVHDRREPFDGPCSPWHVYSTHLLVAAALALGAGPALSCFDGGSWDKPKPTPFRVPMRLENVTTRDDMGVNI